MGKKLTAHCFRHTFATLVAQQVNYNLLLLKEVLGHAQLSTTERYCHHAALEPMINFAALLG